jgi:hypothetical protein
MYGYENARSDLELVREWCILSVSSEAPDYRSNFYSIAKERGKVFNRDLPLLLDLSMKISDYELSLALGALCLCIYLLCLASKFDEISKVKASIFPFFIYNCVSSGRAFK